ncbi:MAG: hypothetical protein ACREBF_02385 [Candidatus Micrarchaeales archaeon]
MGVSFKEKVSTEANSLKQIGNIFQSIVRDKASVLGHKAVEFTQRIPHEISHLASRGDALALNGCSACGNPICAVTAAAFTLAPVFYILKDNIANFVKG